MERSKLGETETRVARCGAVDSRTDPAHAGRAGGGQRATVPTTRQVRGPGQVLERAHKALAQVDQMLSEARQMNTGTVSPPPIAAGEATTDRTRSASRRADRGRRGGGFLKVVSKLAQEQGRRRAAATRSAPGDGRRQWPPQRASLAERAAPKCRGEEVAAGDPTRSAIRRCRSSGQPGVALALAGVERCGFAGPALGGKRGAWPESSSRLPSRRGSPTAPRRKPISRWCAPLWQQLRTARRPRSPDATMLASLAKANSQARGEARGQARPETMVKVDRARPGDASSASAGGSRGGMAAPMAHRRRRRARRAGSQSARGCRG